ncbi:hypothetical protein AQ611_04775 [Burkholderia singularis]|nr:hypothetical protein AQ611_04775 [Burkholderia sp. Bp7605]
MQTIRRIALTCDFLRVDLSRGKADNGQYRNLDWLVQILGVLAFESKWGVRADVIVPPLDSAGLRASLTSDIHAQYLADSPAAWAALYDADDLPAFADTVAALLEYDLIVGFELPPVLKRLLARGGKTYLSLHIHPLRFLRDLCFYGYSNSAEVCDMLSAFGVPDHEIAMQVRRLRALFFRRHIPAFDVPAQTPVLIGQTPCDAALIRDGRFVQWRDCRQSLDAQLAGYDEIFFLEHPYEVKNGAVTEFLRSELGKSVTSVRANGYGFIFSSCDIPFFLSLSSSLGLEAQHAGQRCDFLLSHPLNKFMVPGIDRGASAIGHGVLFDAFWERLLGRAGDEVIRRDESDVGCFAAGNNYLRSSLESWAFHELDRGEIQQTSRRRLIPAASVGNAQSDRVELRSQRMGEMEVEQLPRPLRMGERIAFDFSKSAVEHYLLDGFAAHEPDGVRIDWARAVMQMPLDKACEQVMLRGKLTASVPRESLRWRPTLALDVDGNEVDKIVFGQDDGGHRCMSFCAPVSGGLRLLGFLASWDGCDGDDEMQAASELSGPLLVALECSIDVQDAIAG